MRDIAKVIEAVLNIIPADFDDKETIEIIFENIKDSVAYTAPEIMRLRWKDVSDTLQYYIPVEPKDIERKNWKFNILQVINAQQDYTQYLDKS